MRKTLLFLCLAVTLLTGCLENETPCTLFRVDNKILSSGEWKVDTFHAYISDTATSYYRDTTFLNDGTFQFIPGKLNCKSGEEDLSGTIVFTRKDGSPHQMSYSFEDYAPLSHSFIRIISPTSFDGFAQPYNVRLWNRIEENKIRITVETPWGGFYPFWVVNPGVPYVRYWEFILTRN